MSFSLFSSIGTRTDLPEVQKPKSVPPNNNFEKEQQNNNNNNNNNSLPKDIRSSIDKGSGSNSPENRSSAFLKKKSTELPELNSNERDNLPALRNSASPANPSSPYTRNTYSPRTEKSFPLVKKNSRESSSPLQFFRQPDEKEREPAPAPVSRTLPRLSFVEVFNFFRGSPVQQKRGDDKPESNHPEQDSETVPTYTATKVHGAEISAEEKQPSAIYSKMPDISHQRKSLMTGIKPKTTTTRTTTVSGEGEFFSEQTQASPNQPAENQTVLNSSIPAQLPMKESSPYAQMPSFPTLPELDSSQIAGKTGSQNSSRIGSSFFGKLQKPPANTTSASLDHSASHSGMMTPVGGCLPPPRSGFSTPYGAALSKKGGGFSLTSSSDLPPFFETPYGSIGPKKGDSVEKIVSDNLEKDEDPGSFSMEKLKIKTRPRGKKGYNIMPDPTLHRGELSDSQILAAEVPVDEQTSPRHEFVRRLTMTLEILQKDVKPKDNSSSEEEDYYSSSLSLNSVYEEKEEFINLMFEDSDAPVYFLGSETDEDVEDEAQDDDSGSSRPKLSRKETTLEERLNKLVNRLKVSNKNLFENGDPSLTSSSVFGASRLKKALALPEVVSNTARKNSYLCRREAWDVLKVSYDDKQWTKEIEKNLLSDLVTDPIWIASIQKDDKREAFLKEHVVPKWLKYLSSKNVQMFGLTKDNSTLSNLLIVAEPGLTLNSNVSTPSFLLRVGISGFETYNAMTKKQEVGIQNLTANLRHSLRILKPNPFRKSFDQGFVLINHLIQLRKSGFPDMPSLSFPIVVEAFDANEVKAYESFGFILKSMVLVSQRPLITFGCMILQ